MSHSLAEREPGQHDLQHEDLVETEPPIAIRTVLLAEDQVEEILAPVATQQID